MVPCSQPGSRMAGFFIKRDDLRSLIRGTPTETGGFSDINVYKNILVTSLGNYGGEKLGKAFATETTIPGGQFIGKVFSSTIAGAYDALTPLH